MSNVLNDTITCSVLWASKDSDSVCMADKHTRIYVCGQADVPGHNSPDADPEVCIKSL